MNDLPVATKGRDEGQLHGAGVADVGRDIEQVGAEPGEAEGEREAVALAQEHDESDHGAQALEETAAQDAKELTEPAEDHMAHLMKREIESFDDALVLVVAQVVDPSPGAPRQYGNPGPPKRRSRGFNGVAVRPPPVRGNVGLAADNIRHRSGFSSRLTLTVGMLACRKMDATPLCAGRKR